MLRPSAIGRWLPDHRCRCSSTSTRPLNQSVDPCPETTDGVPNKSVTLRELRLTNSVDANMNGIPRGLNRRQGVILRRALLEVRWTECGSQGGSLREVLLS
jgi:hypothetical protein